MFEVGQRVECIRTCPPLTIECMPVVGSIYRVREVEAPDELGFVGIRLVEIVNPVLLYGDGMHEASWSARWFRPVRDTDISIFTAMLNNVPLHEREVV